MLFLFQCAWHASYSADGSHDVGPHFGLACLPWPLMSPLIRVDVGPRAFGGTVYGHFLPGTSCPDAHHEQDEACTCCACAGTSLFLERSAGGVSDRAHGDFSSVGARLSQSTWTYHDWCEAHRQDASETCHVCRCRPALCITKVFRSFQQVSFTLTPGPQVLPRSLGQAKGRRATCMYLSLAKWKMPPIQSWFATPGRRRAGVCTPRAC